MAKPDTMNVGELARLAGTEVRVIRVGSVQQTPRARSRAGVVLPLACGHVL